MAVVLGAVRLQQQAAHRPAWAGTEDPKSALGSQVFEGFVAIDGHAHRAAAMRDWLRGDDPGGEKLHAFLAGDHHPTTLTVPFATAVMSLTGLAIPWSYFVVVVALFLLTVHTAGRLAVMGLPGPVTFDAYALAGSLVALHVTTTRTVGLLILDWAVALSTVAVACCAVQWSRTGATRHWVGMLLCLLLGLFTKVSALPLCCLPPLVLFAVRGTHRVPFAAFIASAGPGLLAIAAASAWSAWIADASLLGRDTGHLLGTRVRPIEFGIEMLLLGQFLPLLAWRARPWTAFVRWLAVGVVLLLVATAVFRLPSTPRLYLPVLVLGVPWLVAAAGSWLADRRVVVVYVVGNLGLAGLLLWRGA